MGELTTPQEIVAELRDGMTIGIGGWGSRRKPMALVREIYRSNLKDLTIVSCGGPDVGLLCTAGKVRKLIAPFVTMDSVALEPHFREARKARTIEFAEYDEGMFMFGLLAAAHRLPFMPTRAGLGSDVMTVNADLQTVTSPYEDGEELVAVPALTADVSLVHMDIADTRGNGRYLGADPYLDDLFAKAAARTFLSAEELTRPGELGGPPQALLVSRMHVTGVTETPGGAHFTSIGSGGQRDESFQRHYAKSAADPEAWKAFEDRFLSGDEATYQSEVHKWHEEQA
ncbi:MAG: acyl CoA--acetate/3-ketoacid CoA transferase subunit alpha [Streptosporangiales bacterium]|nr:acyl CoA--acetate/3-ketoacid CoA transferase subunit alpha [Streptosporangiales bacterium]